MSLFKAREWWATLAGEDEEYDLGCLCVANIDNSSTGTEKIIVGSYHGSLRVFNPRPVKGEKGWSGFKSEDVMLETHLQYPILQVEAGKFVSASDKLHLAVLHPRKIVVYSITAVSGAVEHGHYCQLNLMYEHSLQRTSYNMCYGPFGGVKGRDFLCVQSMDGTLSVFEQDCFAFSRFLPGALLPGPMRYVAVTDSFVTVSSSRQVESYKYQVLAVATDSATKEESQSIKTGKKVAVDWTYNMGEQALDIYVTAFPNTSTAIMILGERNLFCLTEGGKLKFMKKFDYSPSCFLPYSSVSEGTINYMVATHTNTLLVYQDVTLKWAAQLQHLPVQLKRGNFQDLKGVIVTLDEYGHIDCSYLGTDPALFVTQQSEAREINYADQDQEMQQLQKIIKEQSAKTNLLPALSSDDDVTLQVHVPDQLDSVSQAVGLEFPTYETYHVRSREEVDFATNSILRFSDHYQAQGVEISDSEGTIPSITVKVSIKAKTAVQNVRFSVHTALPLAASQTQYQFSTLDSNRPGEVLISFFLKNDFMPSDLSAEITATYQNAAGAPRVAQALIPLPIKLVIHPCLPVKMATHKVTIDTNKPPVSLNDIFPDLLGENAGGPGNALGFQFYGGVVVTMLASKTSQRYRLQSDVFQAMWIMTNELVKRLEKYFMARRATDFQCSFSGTMPLSEYFDVVDHHFEVRLKDLQMKEVLGQRAAQFRAIQRRLLTKFKDKTPSPLSNLDTLLDGTYRQILALGEAVEENKHLLAKVASHLSSATRLLNLLIRLMGNMTDKEFRVLETSISPQVEDSGELGWEECVDAAITHLLRTCLAKNAKDQTVNPSPLTMPRDTSKLRKHIGMLCDRLSKGAKLAVDIPEDALGVEDKQDQSKKKKSPRPAEEINTTDKDETPGDLGEAEVPVGSKFGEKKSPRKEFDIPPLNGPALSNENGLPPLRKGKLAPLGGQGTGLGKGLNDLSKKKNIESLVPDLDDMGSPPSDGSLLVNGNGIDDENDVVAV